MRKPDKPITKVSFQFLVASFESVFSANARTMERKLQKSETKQSVYSNRTCLMYREVINKS